MLNSKITADNYFAIIPEWVLYEPTLSANGVRLYCTLNRFANSSGTAWPSRRTIAALMNVSVETVDRAKKELVEIGAIIVTNRVSPAGDPTSNIYQVITTPPSSPMPEGTRKGDPTRRGKDDALIRANKNQSQSKATGDCDECHGVGWAMSPGDSNVATRCKCQN